MNVDQQTLQATAATPPATALRILMADDNPQEHILMAMAARGAPTPIEFDFVSDGSKLLTDLYLPRSVDQLPNLIILDLHMPRLNGHRTLEELQAHPIFWQIPVIVLSNSLSTKDEALSYARGAVLFENKPASFSGMREFLKRAAQIARSTNEYEEFSGHDVLDTNELLDVTENRRVAFDLTSDNKSI